MVCGNLFQQPQESNTQTLLKVSISNNRIFTEFLSQAEIIHFNKIPYFLSTMRKNIKQNCEELYNKCAVMDQ